MLLGQNEKVHVMHRTFFEKAGNRTLVGRVEACEDGVARIRGHIFAMDQSKMTLVRQAESVTRFISLVNGEHIITPLSEAVDLEKLSYVQDGKGLTLSDGTAWSIHLSTLTLH